MLRRLVSALIALALLGQSLPSAHAAGAVGHGEGLAHALLHWIGAAHHHHDEGGYDLASTVEAQLHVAADVAGGVVLPSLAVSIARTDLSHLAPRPAFTGQAPPPWLDAPLRPPR